VSLSASLTRAAEGALGEQLRHPTVVGIGRGDLAQDAFRAWLEQDYLFLLDYVRVFSRLAWQAPPAHLGDLVDVAHATWHTELALHRTLAAQFEADLEGAVKNGPCTAYTKFLLDAAADYGSGLAALLPCMWGYSEIGRRLAADPPSEPRYRQWVQAYADPDFAALAARCAAMLDEAAADGAVPAERAKQLFAAGMAHELAFWTVS